MSAVEAAKGYLEALARGDADAALYYSKDQPATKELLTDDILKKQIAKWPITNIRVLDSDSLSVHVAVNFGDHPSDQKNLRQAGRWRWLETRDGHDQATILQLTKRQGDQHPHTLRKANQPRSGHICVSGVGRFWQQQSQHHAEGAISPLLLNDLNTLRSGTTVSLDFDISDSGRAAVQAALKNAFAECAKSKQLHPLNCPRDGTRPRLG
nr:DUF4878 domain-containing protein [Mycobacterium lepraemurium]